jgi:ribokinase
MHVIVVGSVNMDLVFTGLASFPLPGQTVSGGDFRVMPGGKGANQASAAARLGASVLLVAAVGTDDLGDQAMADLAGFGVGLDHVTRVDGSTGVAAVMIEQGGENSIIVVPAANARLAASAAEEIADQVDGPAIVLACLEVPVDTVSEWSRIAARRGWSFVLNPAPAPAQPLPAELLARTSIITPNETELAALGSVESLHAAGVATVVVTQGGDGVTLYRQGSDPHHQAAFPADPVDTTGAGDAFNGAFVTALAEGCEIDDALRFAAVVGALSTRSVGARDALPAREEVEHLLAG